MRPPLLRLAALALASTLAIGLALALALSGSSQHGPDSPPAALGFEGAPTPAEQPRDFTLADQQGSQVSLSAYRGRVVVLAFLATTGTSAISSRLMAQQVRGALEELHKTPVVALAVSTNPRGDTPARVGAFLRRVGLTGRLTYLTGTASRLRAVWRAYTIVPPRPGQGGPDRSAYVVLIDKQGRQRVRFFIEQLTPEALVHDIRKLGG